MTTQITFRDMIKLARFCKELPSEPNFREVCQMIEDGEPDFEVNNVRFISSEMIDEIFADELESDSYLLGCFNTWAIADATGWPIALIEAAKKGEAYQEIGDAMTREHVERLVEIFTDVEGSRAGSGGYGPHFNSYDGSEAEITIGDITYHVFDNQ